MSFKTSLNKILTKYSPINHTHTENKTNTVSSDNNNPVTSGGVYDYINHLVEFSEENTSTGSVGIGIQYGYNYSLTLTSDKSILSYYDEDTATLTATLTDNNVPVANETITFKNGNTTLGTSTTNNNGVATYEYESSGSGDITISAEYSNVVETYNIKDCWNFKSQYTISQEGGSTTVKSIGLNNVHNVQNNNFILEFDFKSSNYGGILCLGASNQWSTSGTANYRLFMGNNDDASRSLYFGYRTTSTNNNYGNSRDSSQWYHMKMVREGTSVKYYIDDVLLGTLTVEFITNYSSWSIYEVIWGSGNIYCKNIQLKKLNNEV